MFLANVPHFFVKRICDLVVGGFVGLFSVCALAAPAAADLVDSIGMPFMRIPAGEFLMGSDETIEAMARDFPQYERQRFEKIDDEGPVHRVRITRDFYLGQTEVTVGQFRRFVELSGYVPESLRDGTGGYGYNPDYDPATSPRRDAFEGRRPLYSWLNPGYPQTDDFPVVNVTWNDAVAMARWLSEKEGVHYRLPTEAEWEYACRAGTRTRFASGDSPESLTAVADVFDADAAPFWPRWHDFALKSHDGFAFAAPVASRAPNAFGLYDMHGNVWEWVADWYGKDTYSQSPENDPQGPEIGETRVRRGGSWHTWSFYARAAFRNWNTPDTRYTLLGFRLLREAGNPGQRLEFPRQAGAIQSGR